MHEWQTCLKKPAENHLDQSPAQTCSDAALLQDEGACAIICISLIVLSYSNAARGSSGSSQEAIARMDVIDHLHLNCIHTAQP